MVIDPRALEPRWITAWTPEQGAVIARDVMREEFGREAQCVWSAPGRLVIVGDHIDYAGGTSLTTVMEHRAYVAAAPRTDGLVRVFTDRADPNSPKDSHPRWECHLDDLDALRGTTGWASYPAGVLWTLLERGYQGPGVDIAIVSCVPMNASMASSGAMTAASARAINDVWKLALGGEDGDAELADVCVDAENEFGGGAAGGVDQHTILRCQPGQALHLDFAGPTPVATHCALDLAEYGLSILVVNTGVSYKDVSTQVKIRRDEVRQAAKALGVGSLRDLNATPQALKAIEALRDETLRKRARHVYMENERVDLVRAELSGTAPAHERFVVVGKAMYRSHASLEVDCEVSHPALNLAVDTAFTVGALGARMQGVGFGGSAIALVRRSQAVNTAMMIDQAFVEAGLSRPSFSIV